MNFARLNCDNNRSEFPPTFIVIGKDMVMISKFKDDDKKMQKNNEIWNDGIDNIKKESIAECAKFVGLAFR
jgi:hypothetical protein